MIIRALALSAILLGSTQATPDWTVGSKWRITVQDDAQKAPQVLTVRVLADRANSCLGGDWKRLELVSGSYKGLSEPAYTIDGDHLVILLRSNVCDSYDQLDGTLKNGKYTARHSQFGWTSRDIGVASARPVK